MDVKQIVFYLLGGLGIFLYGINLVGKALKDLAGSKLKKIIEKSTNTPIKGILIGFIVTAIIQSSSGTTSLVVALVAANLMALSQATWVIIGANIGTAITSVLIGLNITDLALPILGIGAILAFIFSQRKIKLFGETFVGFGMLFFGLQLMGDGVKPIMETQFAIKLFTTLSDVPILGMLVGLAVTIVIQSSSASIGILQTLYGTGSTSLSATLPIMIGCCIGTTITALIASIAANKQAKRAAMFHVVYNIFGAIIFMILINPFTQLTSLVETNILMKMHADKMMTIAFADIFYKIISALILVWFNKYFVKLTYLIIKGDERNDLIKNLEETNIKDSAFSLQLSFKAIEYMCGLVWEMFENTKKFSFEKDMKLYNRCLKIEEKVDEVDVKIHDYLIKVAQNNLDKSQSYELAKHMDTIRDLERISDHCMNLLECFLLRYDNNEVYSSNGKLELEDIFSKVEKMVKGSIEAFKNTNKDIAQSILLIEDEVDDAEEKYRKNHLLRMYNGICKATMANNFSDILSNLERIGDHSTNIAEKIISGDEYFE